MKSPHVDFDDLILLQPTSPLRDSDDIDAAIDLMSANDSNAVISVNDFDNKCLKTLVKGPDGFLEGAFGMKLPFIRRQDLPQTYMPNGAIYLISIDLFLSKETFLVEKTQMYLMPLSKSIDVDIIDDINLIEKCLGL